MAFVVILLFKIPSVGAQWTRVLVAFAEDLGLFLRISQGFSISVPLVTMDLAPSSAWDAQDVCPCLQAETHVHKYNLKKKKRSILAGLSIGCL